MVQITVTAEQAMRIGETSEPIEILDPQGKSIGFITKPSVAPFSSEEIAEAKRRSKSQSGGRTTEEVFDRLSKLESR